MARTTGNAKDLITFTRASTGTFLGSNGLLQTAAINTPRVEYDANGVAKGLLIEEARTNIRTNSAAPNTSNNYRIYGTSSPSTETAPDGTPNAILLDGRWDNYPNDYGQSSNQTQTYSAFVKPVGATSFRFSIGGSHAEYNFSSGLWSYLGLTGGFAETYPNGWIRLAATLPSKTNAYHYWGGEFLGTTTTGHVWGIQLENAPFPTSYIPTSGATATRSADIASVSVSEFGYNQAQGSVVVEANPILSGSPIGHQGLVEFNNGTTNDQITILNENNDRLRIIIDPSATTNDVDFTISGAEGSEKYAAAWATNNVQAAHGGLLGAGDTSSNPPATITTLTIGNDAGSNTPLNGHIKSINYYPLRLSDAKLQELTS